MRTEASNGSFFGIFHALSFELNLFLDRSFPLRSKLGYASGIAITHSLDKSL